MTTTQQQIPFILEGNTTSRDIVRTISTTVDGLRKIDFELLRIRPAFNARRNVLNLDETMYDLTLGIPALADAIFANNGPADPLRGDFYSIDNCFYITNGERRFRALRHLLKTGREIYPNGKFVSGVHVMINPPKTTDLERKRMITSTQDNLKLKKMELAYHYLSYKTEYDMTHEQIAVCENASRQTVDNYILATELPLSVQCDIDNDTVKLTNALSDLRKSRGTGKKKGTAYVDMESGEILSAGQENALKDKEAEKDKIRGDEEEFLQQDNSITGGGSMGGPKTESSGSIVIGKDAIYMDGLKLALWKQMINRFRVLELEIINGATLENGNLIKVDDILAERLKNEYNLTVK